MVGELLHKDNAYYTIAVELEVSYFLLLSLVPDQC